MPYLSNLDGIRAIAVLLVVVSHIMVLLTKGVNPADYDFHAMGHVGVAIFFVHTTLVLMASLERHGRAAIPFYVRRIFRIYPLSIAIVLLMALLHIAGNIPLDTAKVWSNLFLVMNLTSHNPLPDPLWSLPYEVQMYLVLPALYGITTSLRPVRSAILLCAIPAALVLTLPAASFAYKLLRFVPCFLPGVLAFVLLRRSRPRASPAALFGLVAALGIIGIPALVASGVSEVPLLWCLCFAIGLTIPACRQIPDGVIARGARLIAKYSYGIYITHVLALGAIQGLMPGPPVVQWMAMLTLLAGMAYACYHGIETRGIVLGASLADRYSEKLQRDDLRGTTTDDQPGRI